MISNDRKEQKNNAEPKTVQRLWRREGDSNP